MGSDFMKFFYRSSKSRWRKFHPVTGEIRDSNELSKPRLVRQCGTLSLSTLKAVSFRSVVQDSKKAQLRARRLPLISQPPRRAGRRWSTPLAAWAWDGIVSKN